MQKIRSFLIISIIISFLVGGLSGLLSGLLLLNWSTSFDSPSFFRAGTLGKIIINNNEEKPENVFLPIVKSDSEKIIEVVKKSSPAVVSIIVRKDMSNYYNQTGPLSVDDLFKNWDFPFDLKLDLPEQPETNSKPNLQQVGSGSGFLVRSNGLIVTNKHVVSDLEAEYTVVTSDGKRYPALVLAKDQFLDIALIKIEEKNLPFLTLGNSDKLEIGQTVVAIGNALGQYQNTVTSGIVSGIKRRVVASGSLGNNEIIEAAIQTDAAINPGNSGGPLLNLRGEVVGINTAVTLGSQSVGFALPVNAIKVIVESVEKYGHIVRPWLGVRYLLLNQDLAQKNNLSLEYGALIIKGDKASEPAVMPDSPADKVGLKEDDVILEVNQEKVNEQNTLGTLIGKYKVGEEVVLKVWRKGEEFSLKVKLEEALSK